jgi:chorismate synthase
LGAVRAVEIGDGFAVASLAGSENNDKFINKDNKIGTQTNHSGGVLGGITTGEEFILRAAVKPPASIGIEQQTVDKNGNPASLKIEGRHDPTIVPRIVPVVEAMAAIVTVDFLLRQESIKTFKLQKF